MLETWYHGTNESSAINICESGVDFSKSKKELDFGIGFYLTDDDSVARRRAFQKTEVFNRIHKSKEHPALVSVILETDLLTDMSVRVFEYCNDEWVRFVLANRLSKDYLIGHNALDHNLDNRYDIVRGSIADSDISELAHHINNGDMDISEISVYDALTFDGRTLGEQLSLHTIQSIACIKTMTYEIISGRRD